MWSFETSGSRRRRCPWSWWQSWCFSPCPTVSKAAKKALSTAAFQKCSWHCCGICSWHRVSLCTVPIQHSPANSNCFPLPLRHRNFGKTFVRPSAEWGPKGVLEEGKPFCQLSLNYHISSHLRVCKLPLFKKNHCKGVSEFLWDRHWWNPLLPLKNNGP